MKNNYITVFCIFISTIAFSQSDLFFGSWILERLVIDNTPYNLNNPEEVKTDDNGNRIILNFNESTNYTFDTYICNSKVGEFNFDNDNNNFTIISTSTTLDSCNDLGDSNFENLYFDFFQASTIYSYSIGCLLSGSSCHLDVISPNGDIATFWNGQLSIDKNVNLDFSIYPNPVNEKLNIVSSKNNIKIKIFDFNGKLIMYNILPNTKSINVQSLKKGMYFISITDELRNTSTKKFLK